MNDVISRQAAIDALDKRFDSIPMKQTTEILLLRKDLRDLPPAERKTGRWIRHNTYHGDDTSGFIDPDWRCSECGNQASVNVWSMYDLTDFCPHCGADMRGEKNETD